MDPVKISFVEEKDWSAWDEYILSMPSSCFYQSSFWAKILAGRKCFEVKSLVARHNNKITGILPLFLVKKPFLGSKLISIPFDMTSGGVVCEDAEVLEILLKYAVNLAVNLQVKYLEIRACDDIAIAEKLGFKLNKPFQCGMIPLIDVDSNYKRLDSSRRNDISRCRRSGIVTSAKTSIADFFNYYAGILAPHFKQRGSPLFSFGFVESILKSVESPKSEVVLISAEFKEKMIGGAILYCYGDTVVLKSLASLPEYRRSGADPAIVWKTIEYGLENNYRSINFGISDRTKPGQIHFKKDLGSEIKDTLSYTYAVKSKPVALDGFSEERTKFIRKIWAHMPNAFTDILSPQIIDWLC